MRPLLLPRLSALGVIVAVHFLEFGFNHALVRLGLRRVAAFGRSRALLGLVHGLAELHGRLRQGVGLGLDVFGVFALVGGLQRSDGVLDGGLLGRADLVAKHSQNQNHTKKNNNNQKQNNNQHQTPQNHNKKHHNNQDQLLDVG